MVGATPGIGFRLLPFRPWACSTTHLRLAGELDAEWLGPLKVGAPVHGEARGDGVDVGAV